MKLNDSVISHRALVHFADAQIRYARLRSLRELHFITATTHRNEKLVLYLFTRNRMQIFERCLDIKSRENFRLLKVLKNSHIHLKTQECKMDVNDKKTAISLRENGANKEMEMQTTCVAGDSSKGCKSYGGIVYILAKFVFDNLYKARSISVPTF
ncbi:hypothetical protein T07_8863 [Trichinella nelsoni]|uniref:Uncharacterized protein n=1 Tax=Trichinella nelsoni TaxID=6336 RepID=A0A0V0RZH4_9BILA|nr:hypothetical protein T07_8863 [Trichinella nelsoni]